MRRRTEARIATLPREVREQLQEELIDDARGARARPPQHGGEAQRCRDGQPTRPQRVDGRERQDLQQLLTEDAGEHVRQRRPVVRRGHRDERPDP